jgi:exopolysaccharide production protein ExoZ
MRPLVGQGWTLNYEMFFYAMFAIALLMPLRRGIALFFALIVALVGAGLYVAGAGDKHIAQMVHFYLQPILLLFGVGVAMRLFEKSYVEHVASKRPLLLISGILTATIAAVIVFRIPNILPVWAQVVMWSPSIAVVMIAVGARPNTDMIAERVLGRLGDASYSVYLFHLFILAAIEKVLPTGVAMPLGVAFFVAALLSANVAGFVIFKFVERPITAWLLSSAERLSPKILGNTGLPERG